MAAREWKPRSPAALVRAAGGHAASIPGSPSFDNGSVNEINLKIGMSLGQTTESVTVQAAGDLLETDSTAHTDVDRQLFDKLPLESASSSVSSLVTLASPGVAADSNGLFHGLGDHAENSFSVDGQPITDQQSKVFSNQIPLDSIASIEVIPGAPPAEYGDKTSLIIDVTTRSGQGLTTPHGDLTVSYGTFGQANVDFDFGYGRAELGEFLRGQWIAERSLLIRPKTPYCTRREMKRTFSTVSIINFRRRIRFTGTWGSRVPGSRSQTHWTPSLRVPGSLIRGG